MKRNRSAIHVWSALLVVLLVGCGAPEAAPTATEAPAAAEMPVDTALKVTGQVEREMGWTEEQVHAMETIEAEATNSKGETSTYTGVLIHDLLEEASVQSGATMVVFVADDGYTAEAGLSEVQDCADCIVSFRSQGGFSTVMPGHPGSLQVKGVVEIQVK